jgi:hypothetical protein
MYLRAKITRYMDAAFPGWAECSMVDALGHEHLFVEKVPCLTAAALHEASDYPQPGFISCVVVGTHTRDDGRETVRIDSHTTSPGETRFEVFAEQLTELPQEQGGR